MGFHRLGEPSYTGGSLPAGYDWINNYDGVSGTPVVANGAIVGGDHAGSYFFNYAEQLASANINRPILALAENCDILDDILHNAVAEAEKHTVNNTTLPAGTYLGNTGHPNTAAGYAQLFTVIDAVTGEEARVNNVACRVTAVSLGGGDSIGGQFSGNTLTVTITPTPTASYNIYYFKQSDLATLSHVAPGYADLHARGGNDSFLKTSYYAGPTEATGALINSAAITVPAGAFVTSGGLLGADELFVLTDENDLPMFPTAGGTTRVTVSSLVASGGIVDGFAVGTTALTLSAPVTGNYKIRYGTKKSMLFTPTDNGVLYALNEAIRVSRRALVPSAPETLSGNWAFTTTLSAQDLQINGDANFDGLATFNEPIECFGNITASDGIYLENGPFYAESSATFQLLCESRFDGNAEFYGTIKLIGTPTVTGTLEYVAASVTRYAQMSDAYTPDTNRWAFASTSGSTGAEAPRWYQPNNANTHPLLVPLVLPTGSTLVSVSMNIKGASGHGAMPADKPSIEVVWQPIDSDTLTEVDGLGPQIDSTTVVGTYEASHQVSRLSYSETVLSTRRYWARIKGEGGANAVDGLELFSVRATCTVTAQEKWTT